MLLKIKGENYYEVKDMTKEFGVSRKQLSDYEKMGLLFPAGHIKSNYKIYDSDGYLRMAIVSNFRKLGFSLKKINEILSSSEINIEQELDNQLEKIISQKEELDEMISSIHRLKYKHSCNNEDFAGILFGKAKKFERISDILTRSYRDNWLVNLDEYDLSSFCREAEPKKVLAAVFDIDDSVQEIVLQILNDDNHYTHLLFLLDIGGAPKQIDRMLQEIMLLKVDCEVCVAVNGSNSKKQSLGVIGIY